MLDRIERAFEELRRELEPIAPDLGVPTNIRIANTQFADPDHAVITVVWDPPEGADGADVEHEFWPAAPVPGGPSPYEPAMRLIRHVTAPRIVIGGAAPFLLAPGSQYTLAIYATQAGKRAPVPGVATLQIPPYEPPGRFPEPYAWAQGQIVNDALVVPVLIGPPGGATTQVHFRHTQDPDIADSGAFELTIDSQTADALNLPNLGAADVSGVGGGATGYYTQVDIEFPGNGRRENNVNAVVISGFGACLIGLRFAVNRRLIMAEDTVQARLIYWQA